MTKTVTRGRIATSLCGFISASSIALACAQPGFAQDKPELRIAAIVSVTGAASALGAPERSAVELFDKTWSTRTDLPFKVKVISYDDGSDPTKAVSLTRKAIEEDKAHVVVCCTTTPSSMAILDTVKAAKITMISMASNAAIVEPASERPFTFKTPTSDKLMLQRTLNYMKRQGIKKIGFFGLEDAYGEGGLKELQPVAKEVGIELAATERFARQDTNFTPQALRLKQAGLDAVYIHAIPPSADLAHEALKRVGYTGPIYHGAGSSINAFVDIAKANVEGAIVGVGALNVYDQIATDNPLRPVLAKFAELYDGAYGKGKVDLFAGQSWDAMLLAVNAYQHMAEAKTDDLAATRIAIKNAMEQTREWPGVNGVFNVTPTDHLGLDKRSTFLSQIKGGRFVLIEE
ncbi:ABC transporter substrate-binding protein [Bradyrhizobium sp. Pear77]|uniref:ABC transporter substrate-binding protein n=1 Tax=Bradyrhizobium TaxID=374 RepID=UPI001E452780|nr:MULTISPECIES: ABC transporter substrate-binding protein [Bradyrhizobium]MCC8954364.1 ABC transporter substrate-binding protein [Bradyrhizobium altum]MCC8964376.1 ABC transporter substrate-binding protein [Bradyrhizobium oropedii]